MHIFVQQLINGLSIGVVYALIALGYTMVYGVLRLINFAHGDVYMVGALTAWYLAERFAAWHFPPWLNLFLIFILSAVACALLGFLIERLAYRPLRNRPRLVSLITAIGVSLFLENFFQEKNVFGATPRMFPDLFTIRTYSFPVGGKPVTLTNLDLISFALTLVLMVTLYWIVTKTKTGLALRAVSFRFDTASLMGIETNRIIAFTFVLGSALAAVAGVLDAIRYGLVEPDMGLIPGLKAFVAAVIGGIGNIPGAVVGGLLMGLLEAFLRGSSLSGYADAFAFLALIIILLVRPSGLLGKSAPEKV